MKDREITCLTCKRFEEDMDSIRRDAFMLSAGLDCLVKNTAELKDMKIKLYQKILVLEKKVDKRQGKCDDCKDCSC